MRNGRGESPGRFVFMGHCLKRSAGPCCREGSAGGSPPGSWVARLDRATPVRGRAPVRARGRRIRGRPPVTLHSRYELRQTPKGSGTTPLFLELQASAANSKRAPLWPPIVEGDPLRLPFQAYSAGKGNLTKPGAIGEL